MVMFTAAVFLVPTAGAIYAAGSDDTYEFVSYYDQLDANGKAVFDAMNSADAYTSSLVVDLPVKLSATSDNPDDARAYLLSIIKKIVDDAADALRSSSPMAYWGWGASSFSYPAADITVAGNTATVTTFSFQVSLTSYPKDPVTGEFQGIQKMLDDLNAAVDKFSTESTTVRGKVLDINNYITKLATYDPNWNDDKKISIYSHDAYGVFVDPNHYAVCDGYSKAFLLLCEKENIECVVVSGTSLVDMVNHAWNYVLMDDGKWYAIDVTWNDNTNNSYFLKGSDTFFQTHHQGTYLGSGHLPNPFEDPVLSTTSYDSGPPAWYMSYAWVMAFAIVALLSVALYRYAKRSG